MRMKVRDCFDLNPVGNTNKYSDFINYIDTSSVNAGRLSNVTYLEEVFPSRAQRLVKRGDILYSSVRPNLRHYYLYNDNLPHAVASTGFVLLRNKSEYYTKFAYYYLTTNEIVKHLSNIAELSQSTFPSFSTKDIGKIDLPQLDKCRQKRIASILSVYDDLIEVNNKRIKVLEQMAENLYKEWFVRFRFPGHETAEFENGLPKGWRIEKLNAIADFQYGKIPLQEHIVDNGYPIFTGYRTSGFYDSYMYEKPMLLVVARGVGGTGDVKISPPKAFITNLSIVFLLKNPELLMHYLYQLFQLQNLRYLDSGAAQSQITIEDLQRVRIILPDSHILMKYNNAYLPISNEILLLEEKNINLIKQRDLLLPRMMSGKQEV